MSITRSMQTSPAGRVHTIATSNGVKTTTRPFYLHDLPTYVPNADGYNQQLAEQMWEVISATPELWDQDSWRSFFAATDGALLGRVDWLNERDVETTTAKVRSALVEQLAQDTVNPKCGTAMCAAGWVSELTGADFVVDYTMSIAFINKFGRDTSASGLSTSLSEYILVPRAMVDERLQAVYASRGTDDYGHRLPDLPVIDIEKLVDYHLTTEQADVAWTQLRKRGFSSETHQLVNIANWAIWQLGLRGVSSEVVPMFSGGNRLEHIRVYLDCYAIHGPSAHNPWEFDDLEVDEETLNRMRDIAGE
jgi:hypothetical protein